MANKKYSYGERLKHYDKRYKGLETKKNKLTSKERNQMMYAKGYCDLATGKDIEEPYLTDFAYSSGWLNSAKAQEKARSFRW